MPQPFFGLTAQFCRFVNCRIHSVGTHPNRKARQDGLARHRSECAALGDLDRGGERFRNVGEQNRHFRARLEAMIRRKLLAIGLGDQTPAGDAQQRIVGFVVIRRSEVGLVGGDERKAFRIGKIDQTSFDTAFLLDAVALQFDIKAVAEQACQPFAA